MKKGVVFLGGNGDIQSWTAALERIETMARTKLQQSRTHPHPYILIRIHIRIRTTPA